MKLIYKFSVNCLYVVSLVVKKNPGVFRYNERYNDDRQKYPFEKWLISLDIDSLI